MSEVRVIIHNMIIFMNSDTTFEAEMEDNGGLYILSEFYGDGKRYRVEPVNRKYRPVLWRRLRTVDNGSNEDIFTGLDLFQD